MDLLQFAKHVEGLGIVPYVGLSKVNLNHSGCCIRLQKQEMRVLEFKFPTKVLQITAPDSSGGADAVGRICKAAEAAIERLILANAHQLMELSIMVPSTLTSNIQSFARNNGEFPELRVLKLDFEPYTGSRDVNRPRGALDFVKNLVKMAPNLELLSLERNCNAVQSASALQFRQH